MADFRFERSADIAAPPQRVYGIVADYHSGHPRILPKQFHGMVVENGGIGDGTIVRFQVTLFARTQTLRARVTEPEPGRVLVEAYQNGTVTTFTADPLHDGRATRMTITTVMPSRGGVLGAIERFVVPRVLRPIYADELTRLDAAATE
jgi:Polyketide cyclase / dehydrase and lipid transport